MARERMRPEAAAPLPDWNEELARLSAEPERLPAPADSYLTPAGVLRAADRLVRAHGGRPVRIGVTREDRSIWAIHFGPIGSVRGVFLLSLLHACEWIGPLALLAAAERIVRESPDLPLLLVPIANPDGAARAHASVLNGRPRFLRGNARGIDLNRNFPVGHRPRGFMSSLPWVRPGPFALSEPETASIAALAREALPSIAISFHSFGRWFFYPPAHRARPSPGSEQHGRILENAGGAASIGYRSRQLGRWRSWFRAHGTEIDFLNDEVGSTAFLVEISGGGIGRWGVRRIALPFYWYNPPKPEAEIEKLAAFCARLVSGRPARPETPVSR